MTNSLARAQSDDGYTLLELMIALILLGFLSLLLFGGLRLGNRVWERSEDVTANANRIRNIQQLLTNQIQQIYPKVLAQSGIDFDGEPSSMRFLTTASDTGALKRVSVLKTRDGDALGEANGDELANAAPVMRPLLTPLSSLSFTYYGQEKGESAPRWHQDWRQQSHLPDLIRVSAILRDRALAFPTLIIAPRIQVDESCVLDALTHDCQGL